MKQLTAVCIFLLAPALGTAQWLDYPTANVPKLEDGSPNLAAPVPRTADGKPDLSGMWYAMEVFHDCVGQTECIAQMGLPMDQRNIGRTLEEGLPFQDWAREVVGRRTARKSQDDPHARCLPPNFPRAYSFPQYVKFVQTPELIVMLHEFNASYRQVFLDGRPLPEEPFPAWNGYSVGHWEGDTLVIESNGFRDELWLDLAGSPLTDEARITERLTRKDYGHLDIEVTVNDPKAYTRPWTVTLHQEIVLNTGMFEEICLENEQDVKLLSP
ncbi:MAG: hypothetical protein H6978_02905 [Gammaproteobacteria bacterium]|nr:hypothetical protein [Gammaproteobacteria bacterium]